MTALICTLSLHLYSQLSRYYNSDIAQNDLRYVDVMYR